MECVLVVKGVVDFRVGIVVVEIQFSMNRLLNAQTIHWSRTRSWRRGASLSYLNGVERHESTWVGYFLSALWRGGWAESKGRT